jgi:hypothetical protein
MRRSLLVSSAGAAALGACSLTTSFDGLAGGGDDAGADGRGPISTTDAGPTIMPSDGGTSAYRAMVVADVPVLYYRLSDRGTTAKDEMGHRDGTYVGNIDHAQGAIAGEGDTALSLNGNGWVDVGDVYPFTGNAAYSIEAWVAPKQSTTLTGVLARNIASPNAAPHDGYSLYLEGSLQPTMGRWLSDVEQSAATSALPQSAYSYVVGTYDGAELRVYLNGQLAATGKADHAIVSVQTHVTLGATRNGTYGYFTGSLDEVALYDKVLPSERITAHYQVGRATH